MAFPHVFGTPTRSHRSVDYIPLTIQFLHVELIRSEGIPAEQGLTPRSI